MCDGERDAAAGSHVPGPSREPEPEHEGSGSILDDAILDYIALEGAFDEQPIPDNASPMSEDLEAIPPNAMHEDHEEGIPLPDLNDLVDNEPVDFLEFFPIEVNPIPGALQSLPGSLPILGDLRFSASVMPSPSFSFSKVRNCIYAGLHSSFAIRFDWSAELAAALAAAQHCLLFIRVTPVYTDTSNAHLPVHRCIQHTDAVAPGGRCVLKSGQERQAIYSGSGEEFLSVLVPAEPGAGSTTHVFGFACLTGCATGMNRRKIALECTLETHLGSYGRRRIFARPCARHKRDMEAEEERLPAPAARRRRAVGRAPLHLPGAAHRGLHLLQVPMPNLRAMRACMTENIQVLRSLLRTADRSRRDTYRWCIRYHQRQLRTL